MPCSDITEIFEAHLGFDDRLLGYSLRKRTCGVAIGTNDLMRELFLGKDVASLLALPHEHVGHFTGDVGEAEFLPMKHYAAMQAALSAYSGVTGSAPKDACTIASIEVDHDGVHLVAHVAIEAVIRAIKACGNCGSCGSHEKSRSLLPVIG